MIIINFLLCGFLALAILTIVLSACAFIRGFIGELLSHRAEHRARLSLYFYSGRNQKRLLKCITMNLKALRLMDSQSLRIVKEVLIAHYEAGAMVREVLCECIDRLIVGMRVEDRDVAGIIKTVEEWNRQVAGPAKGTA